MLSPYLSVKILVASLFLLYSAMIFLSKAMICMVKCVWSLGCVTYGKVV